MIPWRQDSLSTHRMRTRPKDIDGRKSKLIQPQTSTHRTRKMSSHMSSYKSTWSGDRFAGLDRDDSIDPRGACLRRRVPVSPCGHRYRSEPPLPGHDPWRPYTAPVSLSGTPQPARRRRGAGRPPATRRRGQLADSQASIQSLYTSIGSERMFVLVWKSSRHTRHVTRPEFRALSLKHRRE